jgi:hypothetical protein
MYHILNFYTIIFLIFFIQKINSKMLKCGMMVLTVREKIDMTDADLTVN